MNAELFNEILITAVKYSDSTQSGLVIHLMDTT